MVADTLTLPKGFVLESGVEPPKGFVLEEPKNPLESVLAGEEKIDNLLPPEDREGFNQVVDLSDNPEKERERLASISYFASEFEAPPDIVGFLFDDIVDRTNFNPAKSKPEERGFFGKIAESWRRGDAQVMGDIAVYEAAFEDRGDEAAALSALKKVQLEQALDPIEGNFLADLVYSGIEVVPGMVKGYWSAIPQAFAGMSAGALMALAAGQVPPLTAAPEEVGTVPAGAALGLRFGLMTGSATFWYKQGAGSMYAAMIEKGYSPEISMHVAGIAAVPYAIVEFLQVSQLTPGLRRGALQVAQKSMLKVMANAAKKYGTVWGTEVFEEIVQEVIQITAEDVSGFLSDKLKIPSVTDFLMDRGRRLWLTTKEAGKAMALLPIPGATIDIYTGKRAIVPVEEKPAVPPTVAAKPPTPAVEAITPTEPTPLAKAPEAKPAPEVEKPAVKEISPIVEPELTKQEEADIAKLEAEIEEPFEMVRVKDVGFVIKEKATGKEAAVIPKRKAAKAKLAELNKAAKEIKPGRRPKVLTTKVTIGKLITEAQALKAAMKKAAQRARKAFAAGKAEGIAKVKTYYQGLRLREQARKQLKQRIDKAVKVIRKPAPASVDFFYREAIEHLQAGIDPSFRTKKTLRMREKTREFLARKPEALKDMPVKLMKKLEQKTLQEYTVADLEQIAIEIERLKKLGKLKRKLKLTQKARKLKETTRTITETIADAETIKSEEEPVVYSTTREGFIKTAWEKARAWTWRPSRIFDMLDGGKATFASKAHRTFIDQVNRTTDKKLRMEDKRKDAGKAKMKELNLTFTDLAQTREVDGVKYTVDEMIGIYNANKNRLAKLAVMYGNNISEDTISKTIGNLAEKEKAWGDYIVQDYDENYARLRQVVIEVENRDMGYEENYTPIRRTEVDYTTHTEEIIDAIMHKEHLRRAYAKHGMTIKRKEVPAEFQKPIRLNATGTWFGQVAKQEHYIHFASLIRDLHRIAENKEFRAAVEQQFGKEFNKVIKNYIDRTANPNIYKSYNALENLSRRLRQNAVIAYLAYNLVTMAKQIPSVFLYLQDAGPTHLISSAMQFTEHPIKMVKMVREKDPQVKHRAIERELEEMKQKQPDVYGLMLNKFGKAGMEGIYLFDAVARTIGWNAVYQKALHNGASEAEAVRLAQNATLRTQPAASAKDLAQLYATNEFANWFTMFTNQLNQIYNIATYDFGGYVKNKEYQEAALALAGLGVTALMIWIITHRRLPETPEDFADAAAEQAINAIPLVGKAIMAGKKGWGKTEIPAFELPKATGQAISAVAKGEFDENDLKIIARGIAVTGGIPYTGPKRVMKMVETGELKELIGGEPIERRKGKPLIIKRK